MTKFSHQLIKLLIETRNNNKNKQKFINARNNAYKTSSIWDEVAVELGLKGKGVEVKDKYNNLLKQYRNKKLEMKNSGAGRTNWKYYEDFDEVETVG